MGQISLGGKPLTVTDGAMSSGSATLTSASAPFTSTMVGYNVTVFGGAAGTTANGNGTITNGLKVLTSVSAPFTAGMVGNHIKVVGAGAGGTDLITTIAVFTSTSSVTLTDAAGTTVTTANIVIYNGTLSSTISTYVSATQVTLAATSAADTSSASTTIYWGGSATVDTSGYQYVVFSSNLTSTDTVTIKVVLPDGAAAVVANDFNGTSTGLSSSRQCRLFYGGPTYKLTKVGTAGQAEVFVDFCTKAV